MFSAKSYLEVKIGQRTYHIMCDADSPLTELISVMEFVNKSIQKVLDESSKEKIEPIEAKAE